MAIVGWRRVISDSPCDFCVGLLAQQGTIYDSEEAAEFEAHDGCSCTAEPIWARETEPPEVRLLQEAWDRVTAGLSGKAAVRAWRKHWRATQAVPEAAKPFHLDLDGIEDLAATVGRAKLSADRVRLRGGGSAVVDVVNVPGARVVFKGMPGSRGREVAQADAEQAVSMMARALRVGAPRVYRDEPGAVWMDHIDAPSVDRLIAGVRTPAERARLEARLKQAIDSDDGRRLGLLDLLTEGNDRHTGNWLLSADGPPRPIDHAYSFGDKFVGRVDPPLLMRDPSGLFTTSTRGPFATHYVRGDVDGHTGEWAHNPLTRADVVEIRRRLQALRPAYRKLGREVWLDHALDVLAAIEPHARGTRNLFARS